MKRHIRTDMYIMKAYHIYEQKRSPKLSDLLQDFRGYGGFVLFGKRFDGKNYSESNWPAAAVCSAGSPQSTYTEGQLLDYTIDTGMGYRCNGYNFRVEGWVMVNADGSLGESHGCVPELNDKVNAYVFK
jgi:hypothetical protein